MKGANSVELTLTVPECDQRSAAAALQLDPLDAQVRQVVFFDTPDLTLNDRGLVVRARRTPGPGRRLGREVADRGTRARTPLMPSILRYLTRGEGGRRRDRAERHRGRRRLGVGPE